MDVAGSVRIADAFANSSKTMIRDGVGIDRMTRKVKDGAKYDIEVVPKGGTFEGTITVENLNIDSYQLAKLGGLLSLIEFFNATSGRLGHATSRGFGRVSLLIDVISILTPEDYLKGQFEGTSYKVKTDGFAQLDLESQKSWREFLNALPKAPAQS
ncbi:MAG: RAMP superfamily protein [Methanoregula sp. PtaU1.Bin051]|nr:MAG: RAMP superfamily protein [Methanoregula sp. PtaU1.Bin051]